MTESGLWNRECLIEKRMIAYPGFVVYALHQDVEEGFARDNKSAAPLNHRHVISMFEVVLCYVMGRITAAYNNRFLALAVFLGSCELRRMHQAIALKIIESLDIRRKIGFTRMTCSLDHMAGVECALSEHERLSTLTRWM